MADPNQKSSVVIVGAGFAGYNAARELARLIGATTEITVINSTDYFLYLPLMPQVTGGLVSRRTSVSHCPADYVRPGSYSGRSTTSIPGRRW